MRDDRYPSVDIAQGRIEVVVRIVTGVRARKVVDGTGTENCCIFPTGTLSWGVTPKSRILGLPLLILP